MITSVETHVSAFVAEPLAVQADYERQADQIMAADAEQPARLRVAACLWSGRPVPPRYLLPGATVVYAGGRPVSTPWD